MRRNIILVHDFPIPKGSLQERDAYPAGVPLGRQSHGLEPKDKFPGELLIRLCPWQTGVYLLVSG